MPSPKTIAPRKPRQLTLSQMWELSRILKGEDVNVIIQSTNPGLLHHAILMLYGNTKGIESGAHLIVYLDNGLRANHFKEFLTAAKGH